MSWTNLIVQTDKKEVDQISDYLLELGAVSSSIQDTNLYQNNEELLFDVPDDSCHKFWKNNTVQALFEKTIDIELIKASIRNKFKNTSLAFSIATVNDQDWVKLTQSQFNPICIQNKLWIIPTWHKIKDKNAINLILDPGLAFGTGAHPTTHLCLLWLVENTKKNSTVLDYGCGSGILSIGAKKLGAKTVAGVDIDDKAILASKENAKINAVEILWGNTKNKINFEANLVIANILSSSLSVLAPVLAEHTITHGKLALSGILESQENEIKLAYNKWFDFETTLKKNGWILLSGVKR